jgi:trans-2,3-dihydro-3-hydroxyanthranilate isomerase
MRYAFHILDVFTERRFGGNQLAVLPDARGLDAARMQAVARELNFSETTFVLPAELPDHDCRVRIFTPRAEIGFAGHPTIGTALLLARLGRVRRDGDRGRVVMQQRAGTVPVELHFAGGAPQSAELTAPERPSRSEGPDVAAAAAALALSADDVRSTCVASAGNDFVLVEVSGLDALGRARSPSSERLAALGAAAGEGILVFCRNGDGEHDLRARMFAPAHGIPEDPATGSAAVALAGLLASEAGGDGWQRWRIGQGIEMGRPSLLMASARREGGRVVEARVAGAAVEVADGTIRVD